MDSPDFPSNITQIAIFNASHVTTEFPLAFLSTIRHVHPHPEKVRLVSQSDYHDENTLYIIICPAGFGSDRYIIKPKYYINYQLEPTPILERKPYRDFLSGAIVNWDYSRKNVKFLERYPEIKSCYLPLGYNPCISAPDIIDGRYVYSDEGKDVDVLFLGWDVYDRRRKIRDELYQAELRIWFVCGLDLVGMQNAIRRSKICINIHVSDTTSCLETVRLNILLSNQACIVNEDLPDPELEIYRDHLITVPYGDLVQTCVDLLKDPIKRRRLAIKSFQWYRNEREWNRLMDFNQLLPKLDSS
jgi:hypothetical protein